MAVQRKRSGPGERDGRTGSLAVRAGILAAAFGASLLGVSAVSADDAPSDKPSAKPAVDKPSAEPAVSQTAAVDPRVADAVEVGDLLRSLGEAPPDHWVQPDPALVAQGEAIVLTGKGTDPFGKSGSRVSAAFDCTDCHNVVREDPVLTASDPNARMTYAQENGIPYLPGTTFWGMVNRESWFNDDYIKKYGSLVKPANKSLRWAIQLCSAECSQGRTLQDWEMDAVLAYLWTLQVTVGDLGLADDERALIAAAIDDPGKRSEAVALLKSRYALTSPATVGSPPPDRSVGYGHTGDPERGEFLFNNSCLVCHAGGGPGTYRLSASKGSYNELLRFRTQEDNRSFYTVVRHGTRPYGVPMAYMPFYTQERLSDQQLDDLLSFLQAEVAK